LSPPPSSLLLSSLPLQAAATSTKASSSIPKRTIQRRLDLLVIKSSPVWIDVSRAADDRPGL
jgi:hypothetical protein